MVMTPVQARVVLELVSLSVSAVSALRLVDRVQPLPTMVKLELLSEWGMVVVLILMSRTPRGPLLTLPVAVLRFMLLPSPTMFRLRSSSSVWVLPAVLEGMVTPVLLGMPPTLESPFVHRFTGLKRTVLVSMRLALPLLPQPLRQGRRRKQPVLRLLVLRVMPGRMQLPHLMIPSLQFLSPSLLVMVPRTLVRGEGEVFMATIPLLEELEVVVAAVVSLEPLLYVASVRVRLVMVVTLVSGPRRRPRDTVTFPYSLATVRPSHRQFWFVCMSGVNFSGPVGTFGSRVKCVGDAVFCQECTCPL